MRAARYYAREDIRVEDIDEPELSEGKVHVDVEWCGICGSDLHEFTIGPKALPVEPHPLSGQKLPLTLGHELCGRVRNPPAGSRFKHGDTVMVDPRIPCRSCVSCKIGEGHSCYQLGYVGGSVGGGFGERVAVDETSLYPLGSIPLEYAAVIEPLAVVHHAVKETGITKWNDKTVLVLGGGPIGVAMLILLRAHGATNVIVSEPAKMRREQASEFAEAVIDPVAQHVGDRCRELTEGRGVDVVFDCAGVPVALEAGCNAIRTSGLYIMVAVWEVTDLGLLDIPSQAHHHQRCTHLSTEDFEEVMKWMAEGKLTGYEKLVTGRIGVDDIVEKGFKELINNKDQHIRFS